MTLKQRRNYAMIAAQILIGWIYYLAVCANLESGVLWYKSVLLATFFACLLEVLAFMLIYKVDVLEFEEDE